MSQMFSSASNLTNLDLSSFDISSVTDMSSMFASSSNITSIKVSKKWKIGSSTTTENMFSDCGTNHVTVA